MNADKHTPGPWSEVTYEGDSYATIIGPDGDECIAILDGNIPSKAEQEANARLIAAAPDMLSALRAIEARAEGEWDHPALVAFGPLTPDTSADILAIARMALRSVEV